MAAASPSESQPTGDDRNLVPVSESTALSFEDRINAFWQKNRGLILGACVAVVVALLAKGAWDYFARQKELEVRKAYAAATTSEQLKAFLAANPDHTLGAIAQLRLADEAYTAGKAAEAVAAYDNAVSRLEEGPLVARAKLGRAMAKVQAGQTAEATTELKALAEDANQLTPVRAEATYHLASLAAAAGQTDEVQKLSESLLQIDPSSPWSSRAMALRAAVPAKPAPAATPAAGAAPAEAPKVEVKLPEKK